MIRFFFAFILFIVSFTVGFAQQPKENSILWEITGNDLLAPSYLLGTFHLICEQDLHVANKVITAIDAVDQIALEVDLTAIEELAIVQQFMVAKTSLSSQLTEEERAEFQRLLKEKYEIDLESVDQLHPIFLMGMLAAKDISCPVKGYDMEILQLGLSEKKKFIGLEHFSDQIKLINQVYTAKEILAQLYEDEVNNYEVLATAFKREDINELYQLAVDSKQLTTEGKTLLVDNRNQMWVKLMAEIMPKERTLFAVGAGHLAGEQGVIALLRAKGFTVTAILN